MGKKQPVTRSSPITNQELAKDGIQHIVWAKVKEVLARARLKKGQGADR